MKKKRDSCNKKRGKLSLWTRIVKRGQSQLWCKIKYLLSYINDFYEGKRESEYMENIVGERGRSKGYSRL